MAKVGRCPKTKRSSFQENLTYQKCMGLKALEKSQYDPFLRDPDDSKNMYYSKLGVESSRKVRQIKFGH